MMNYRVAIAGSTLYTVKMAEALASDQRFEVVWTLSSVPKIIGKAKAPTNNPLHQWSIDQQIPAFLVHEKISQQTKVELTAAAPIDFLLVVDFGYFIPHWLLTLPKLAPLNIHPSLLPAWRGSSPGQFALLYLDLLTESRASAVSLMVMNESFDQGPIIAQLPVMIQEQWTMQEYYEHCFAQIAAKLPELIVDFGTGKITPQAQPLLSPTPIARRLNKADAFIPWEGIEQLLSIHSVSTTQTPLVIHAESDLLTTLLNDTHLCSTREKQLRLLSNASHAFWPWPGLWTIVTTSKGEKRMKILPFRGSELKLVQIEGKTPCLWRECRNSLSN